MSERFDPDLSLGQPRFQDAELAAVAQAQGAAAAWRRAFSRGDAAAMQAARQAGGDFAVALSTASDSAGSDGHVGQGESAFLAVDRFAIRTLCYRVQNGRLRWAERADALADPTGSDSATLDGLDPQALFDYLYFHAIPSPRTVFAGVQRLPSGHCAIWRDGTLTVLPYWQPAFEEARRPSFAALRDEFRTLLERAVARQLADDGGRPACFLSGGTDSSTVAGTIGLVTARSGGPAAASYSIGFDAAGYDEMAWARLAARHFGTAHHERYVTPEDLVRQIGPVARHFDQPFGNSSALPAFLCADMAAADGVTRLLAGDGGDELFGGNSRYAQQRLFGWYGRVPAPLRERLLQPLLAQPVAARFALLRKGASYVEQARVPLPERLQMYNLLRRIGVAQVLTPEFIARIDAGEPSRAQREVWAGSTGATVGVSSSLAPSELNRLLAFDWRYTLAESDLPKVNGAAQMAGIEVGFPLLDTDLLDFSLRLPADYKLKGNKLRWFFKEALRGFLPDEIIAKKKQGFGLPFGVWVLRHPPLQALASDSLRSLAGRGIVRPDFIRSLLDTLLPAHPGYYGEMVWVLTVLEQWLRGRSSRG